MQAPPENRDTPWHAISAPTRRSAGHRARRRPPVAARGHGRAFGAAAVRAGRALVLPNAREVGREGPQLRQGPEPARGAGFHQSTLNKPKRLQRSGTGKIEQPQDSQI